MLKKLYLKWGHVLAAVALIVAGNTVNVACSHHFYQEEIPDQMKKLRKF